MKGVYFVTFNNDCEYVKIGMTKDLMQRFGKNTDSPYDFEVLAFREVTNEGPENLELRTALEQGYHKLFEEHRHRREWFHLHSDILDVIDYINAESGFEPFVIRRPLFQSS